MVKVNHADGHPAGVARLESLVAGLPNVLLVDRQLSRQEVYDLLSLCDAYVSLHRAEGFGLCLAEAMFLGKPAVATGWSGNLDFMTPENSCLVSYRLVAAEARRRPVRARAVLGGAGPGGGGRVHAQSSRDTGWRERVAALGQQTVAAEFSPEGAGPALSAAPGSDRVPAQGPADGVGSRRLNRVIAGGRHECCPAGERRDQRLRSNV